MSIPRGQTKGLVPSLRGCQSIIRNDTFSRGFTMSFIYIWKSKNTEPELAESQFESIIRHQATLYSSSYGRNFTWSSKTIGDIFIGQIDLIKGVKKWQPWADCGPCGVAWSGICENFLGIPWSPERLEAVHDTAINRPEELATWDGHFAFCTWNSNEGTVSINAGATQSQTLWYTSGPYGWACGSRPAVVTGIVGKDRSLDSDQARLFLTFSYHMAGGSFLREVSRLEPRHQIILRGSKVPQPKEYITEIDYLTSNFQPTSNTNEIYDICAERLRNRVDRQIQHSENPVLHLSGGKDSRCIGAAIFKNGKSITSLAGGGINSPEFSVASNVARSLGFHHTVEVHHTDLLSLMVDQTDRAKLWLRLSDGLQNIRQGLHDGFFNRRVPIHDADTQYLTGVHYGMLKPKTLKLSAKRELEAVLRKNTDPKDGVNKIASKFIEKMDRTRRAVLRGDVSEEGWSFVFYWKIRGSLWGSDAISLMLPAAWWWSPLVDKALVQYSWWLFLQGKRETSFVDKITQTNAPHLVSVPDIYEIKAKRGQWARGRDKILRRVCLSKTYKALNRDKYSFNSQHFLISNRREQMWKAFFKKNNHAWREFSDWRSVVDVIERNPDSAFLWNLATIELLAQEYF